MSRFDIARRTLLRGVGAAVALPLLEAMLDPRGRLLGGAFVGDAQAGSEAPPNLILFAWPNGVDVEDFLPTDAISGSPDWTPSIGLAPLERYQDRIVLIEGTTKSEGWVGQEIDGDAHSRGHATFATGYGLTTLGVGGPSLERAVADVLWNEETPLKSLTVSAAAADAFRGNVSWADATTPVPPFRDPQQLYRFLFQVEPDRPDLSAARKSVLDFVRDDARRLQSRLGAEDCARLDQYFTSIRELEVRMSATLTCEAPGSPAAWDRYDLTNEKADVLAELFLLAFSCGLTRYGVYQLHNRWDRRQLPWLGIYHRTDGHHGISHDKSPQGRADYARIVADQLNQFARMLDNAQQLAGPDGKTLFDQTLFFTAPEHGSTWSDGHYFGNIPVILSGGAGGNLNAPGRYLRFDALPEYADVLLTMGRMVGAPWERFGASGGRILTTLTDA